MLADVDFVNGRVFRPVRMLKNTRVGMPQYFRLCVRLIVIATSRDHNRKGNCGKRE